MSGWGAFGAAALSLVGGERTNRANRTMAHENQDFQERMSNSAYTRGMRDMKQAGLNPILAGKLGGASTPGGAMATMQDTITPAVNTAMTAMNIGADVKLKEANTALTNASTTLKGEFIPTAQAISTVATQVRNLLQAMSSLYGNDKAGYQETINEVQEKVQELISHTKQSSKSIVDKVVQKWDELGDITVDEVKEWFLDITGLNSINEKMRIK